MENRKGVMRKNYENWGEMLEKLKSLESTVRTIHNGMEMEQVSEHILASYITIDNAILEIIQSAYKNYLSSAYDVNDEEKKSIRS